MRTPVAALILALVTMSCGPFADAPVENGPLGVVSSPEARAAEVGAEVLRRGGNAVDASVAVHFALAVTYPFAGNVGGGGFMLIHDPDAEESGVLALDFRETAPAAATRDMYLDAEGEVIPRESLFTHRAAGVPGSVAGLWAAHERLGDLPWGELIEPAVRLAEEGFRLDSWTASWIPRVAERHAKLDEMRLRHVDFLEYFGNLPEGRLVQPELAATLRRIAAEGPRDFYRGETARLIVEEMRRGGGLISLADLESYAPVWREPLAGEYRGHRIVSMPPPSSGGIALLQILAMLETFELPPRMSVEHVHLLAEIEKRAFADRASHLGDPDYYDVPARELLDPDYIKTRLRGISPSSRTAPERVGAGEPLAPAGAASETTHFSVLDGRGMAVACTTTLNGAFGSGIVVDGAGFLLNNEMDDFSAKPGVPNQFGVTGGEANAIAPGKRMLSSMTPTLVFRPDGSLWMALGSPGGPTIITTVMQVLSNRIDYDLTLEEAIDAPRVHHQWPPRPGAGDAIVVERDARYRVEESLLAGLRELGYSVTEVDSLGDVQAVAIEGGAALGVFDERRTGGVAAE